MLAMASRYMIPLSKIHTPLSFSIFYLIMFRDFLQVLIFRRAFSIPFFGAGFPSPFFGARFPKQAKSFPKENFSCISENM